MSQQVVIRSARDVTELVNSGAAKGSHARMIVIIRAQSGTAQVLDVLPTAEAGGFQPTPEDAS